MTLYHTIRQKNSLMSTVGRSPSENNLSKGCKLTKSHSRSIDSVLYSDLQWCARPSY